MSSGNTAPDGGLRLWLPPDMERRLRGKACSENTVGLSKARVLMFEDMVLKVQPDAPWADREATMLGWLEGKLPVPGVAAYEKHNGMSYLLMTRVPGKMSCDEAFLCRPELLAARLAEAMRMLWDVDVSSCPVRRDQDTELAEAGRRVEEGLVDMENTEPETFGPGGFRSPRELLRWLENNKPSFEPVLSHGDFCLPNVFLTEDGIGGLIDLGDAGVGDRWRDISLCHRSLRHNMDGTFGARRYDGNADALFDALGVTPDADKLRWYLLLDELF